MSAIVANFTGSLFPPQKICSLRLHSFTSARAVGRSSRTSPYVPADRVHLAGCEVDAALGHRRKAPEQAAHQRVV
eukprot:4573580-Prymnesium_polylepis.1